VCKVIAWLSRNNGIFHISDDPQEFPGTDTVEIVSKENSQG
jgi:hypothetical protein